MKILTISGSARAESSNTELLSHLYSLSSQLIFTHTEVVNDLPLFKDDQAGSHIPSSVRTWRKMLAEAEGVIIYIPEYIYNVPAMIKNALEWATSSGEFAGKKVLAITFTPHEPRGEKAMQSLLWSLQALDANVIASLSLYKTEVSYTPNGEIIGVGAELLKEALNLFL